MHPRHCLTLADRIHALLVREIGQGVDRQRLLKEPLYARDVLLVCDALHQTALPELAQRFRQALAATKESQEAASKKARDFSASSFFTSLFDSMRGQPAPIAKATRTVTKAAA